jgi:hypothetical protein
MNEKDVEGLFALSGFHDEERERKKERVCASQRIREKSSETKTNFVSAVNAGPFMEEWVSGGEKEVYSLKTLISRRGCLLNFQDVFAS